MVEYIDEVPVQRLKVLDGFGPEATVAADPGDENPMQQAKECDGEMSAFREDLLQKDSEVLGMVENVDEAK